MGRITIFSAGSSCSHSDRCKNALRLRNIPFVEISVTQHPHKLSDMMSLCHGKTSTPQVFFQTRHIGGADDCIRVLQEWDHSSKYPSARARFEAEIANFPDPSNPKFEVPPQETSDTAQNSGHLSRPNEYCVPMGDKLYSVRQVTERLKRTLSPLPEQIIKRTTYSNVFDKHTVRPLLQQMYQEDVWQVLSDFQIVQHVVDHWYRLTCQHTPGILNSYRVWTERVDTNADRLVRHLVSLWDTQDDKSVVLEAICELQRVDMSHWKDTQKMVGI